MGTPIIGCSCSVCQSSFSYNKRLRPSAFVQIEGKAFLIDAAPDLRTQALRHHIDRIDGVLLTHAHHDHTGGLDDLRVFVMREKCPVPILLSQPTLDDIQARFSYMFQKANPSFKLLPKFDIHLVPQERGNTLFQGISLQYMSFSQAGTPVLGFRFGSLAYISDIQSYPDTIFDDLAGVEVLVVSALRHEPSPLHFTIEEAVAFARKVGAETTWFTHIGHEIDHEKENAQLPPNIRLAYDGLTVPFSHFP